MARGKSLADLLDDLRAASRQSLKAELNAQVRDSQIKQLQVAQDWLWADFDWPHLIVKRDIVLSAGQRYYAPPEDVKIDRITKVSARFNGQWCELGVGIEARHLAVTDSDLGVRSWPPTRWAIAEDEQLEVWPIPDQDGSVEAVDGLLRIEGVRDLKPLVDDDDTCDLDSRLVVAFAAAEILAAAKSPDASFKWSAAGKLYNRIKSSLLPRRRFRMFGHHEAGRYERRPVAVYTKEPGGSS